MARQVIDYLILDAIVDDVESMDHIRGTVAKAIPTAVPSLLEALQRLVHDRLVEAYAISRETPELEAAGEGIWPQGDLEELWFRVTSRGRIVQASWEPDAEAGTA